MHLDEKSECILWMFQLVCPYAVNFIGHVQSMVDLSSLWSADRCEEHFVSSGNDNYIRKDNMPGGRMVKRNETTASTR